MTKNSVIMITKEEVLKAQKEWGDAIIKIGSLKNHKKSCVKETEEQLEKLYALEKNKILFKPTKASIIQFRPNKEAVKSYFIGGDENFPEDHGFALQPWTKVHFENTGMILEENRAIAMGNYFFTDLNGNETKVEFTFSYSKNDKDMLKIDLHHSSIPFEPNL